MAICLGGDHVIKYSALKALDRIIPGEYGVVYLDAPQDCEAQKNIDLQLYIASWFFDA